MIDCPCHCHNNHDLPPNSDVRCRCVPNCEHCNPAYWLTQEREAKNQAYWERNQLVLALSRLYPSWLERHPENDKEWEDDWRWIVFVEIPTKEVEHKYMQGGFDVKRKRQLSWHIHDSDYPYFGHLDHRVGNSWDGHTTEEKYRRLSCIEVKRP